MPSLDQMMIRQRVLGNFGEFALRCEDLQSILSEACQLVGEALNTDYAKVMEIEDDGRTLLVRAGSGWSPDVVGTRLRMTDRSSETYSIKCGVPVVVRDITREERFEFPPFLREQGVVAMVNVPIILPGGVPYGLLQVDAAVPREFGGEDIEFLRTYSAILGPVIDRLHKAHSLQHALDVNRRLLHELQHRVKNHIATISSLVDLRARHAPSDEARQELQAVGSRIETLRLVHEHLYGAGSTDRLCLRPFITTLIESLCSMHEEHTGKVRLDCAIEEVHLGPEVAVPLGLILNEFVTNSLKYAFDGQGGAISIVAERAGGDGLRVHIRDNGKGLPDVPPAHGPGSGTGMKLIDGLACQIGARADWSSDASGTLLRLEAISI